MGGGELEDIFVAEWGTESSECRKFLFSDGCDGRFGPRCQNGPKISPISNMTIFEKIAIIETTGKNSVLGRWVAATYLKYEKKMKKFDLEVCFLPKI